MLAAGTLFVLFTSVPVISARKIFAHKKKLDSKQRTARALAAGLSYFMASSVTATALYPLYVVTNVSPQGARTLGRLGWLKLFALLTALALIAIVVEYVWKTYMNYPRRVSWLAGLSAAFLIGSSCFSASTGSITAAVALWFLGIGIIGVLIEHNISDPEKRETYDWTKLVTTIVGALAIFPWAIYPHIRHSWGGGSPMAVTVYFSQDSRILPGQQTKADTQAAVDLSAER